MNDKRLKIGVMQPYFFPYMAYWQLVKEVDKYVIFDDVNYIKRGWIHRNKILDGNGDIRYINICIKDASQNRLINETELTDDIVSRRKVLDIIRQVYGKAPCFPQAFPVIEDIMLYGENNLARFNGYLTQSVCHYLGIDTVILYSSDIMKDNTLKGQHKIIQICKSLNGTDYINASGGRDLYDPQLFADNGLNLWFINGHDIRYKQFDEQFHPGLSIIDAMMFNPIERIKKMLADYTIEE